MASHLEVGSWDWNLGLSSRNIYNRRGAPGKELTGSSAYGKKSLAGGNIRETRKEFKDFPSSYGGGGGVDQYSGSLRPLKQFYSFGA